jgi:TniQ/Tn7-like transposition protein D
MNEKPFVVAPLPDETLDSVVARVFKLNAYGSWNRLCNDAFGLRGRVPGNGILAGLETVGRFLGNGMSGADVLRTLTLWNGLSVFADASSRLALGNQFLRLCHASDDREDCPQLRPRIKQPFRFCPQCLKIDLRTYGVSYWHRSHQMPMVSTCWRHTISLHLAEIPRWARQIILPNEVACSHPIINNDVLVASAGHFARISHDALSCSSPPDSTKLSLVYRQQMRSIGFAVGARTHYTKLADACFNLQKALLTPLNLTTPDIWLSNLLYGHSANPGINLILIATLFEGWPHFIKMWSDYTPEATTPDVPRRREPPSGRVLRQSFDRPGATISTVSKALSWSHNTIRVRARYFGIPVGSREGRIPQKTKRAIAVDLSKGVSRHRIAKCRRVSLSTIDIIRRSSSSVFAARSESLDCKELTIRRRRLLGYLKANPTLRRSDLRVIDKCLYGWLLRHDRSWYETTVPSTSPRLPKRPR